MEKRKWYPDEKEIRTYGGEPSANSVNGIATYYIKELRELFVKNIGFKFTRRAWTEGNAGNDMANFVGHFAKNGKVVGASDAVDYYNKANDFIDTKSYTHSFKEGPDTVFFNKNTGLTAVTDGKGNIKTYCIENNPNKINNYEQRIKNGNYGE